MTKSELRLHKINSSVFFKEFTFGKNDFYPPDGKKELADGIVLLDDLLFIFQVKERSEDAIKDINSWFSNKVLNKAKKQIKNTIQYFNDYEDIPIENEKEQTLNVADANLTNANLLIIYVCGDDLSKKNQELKAYYSSDVGFIHLFSLEDYLNICHYLVTPTEVDEYLKFRERLVNRHREIINKFPEQYILSHFLVTEDESIIEPNFISKLQSFKDDTSRFDMSNIINGFYDRMYSINGNSNLDYHNIIKEISKLKREELKEFKFRFNKMIQSEKEAKGFVVFRFSNLRTKCGFVFLTVEENKKHLWDKALLSMVQLFKYKHRLNKCLGVYTEKKDDQYDFRWAFLSEKWIYNNDLETLVKQDIDFFGKGERKDLKRY